MDRASSLPRLALAGVLCLELGSSLRPASAAEPLRPARAAATSRPVEMTASGGLTVDLERQLGIARGDVVIRRDDVIVCCDEAEARYSEGSLERVTCRGRVVIVRPGGTRAAATEAVFIAREDTVTLTGGARVVTEAAELEGERIVYDIAKDKLTVEGKSSRFRYAPRPGGKTATPPDGRACPPAPPEKR